MRNLTNYQELIEKKTNLAKHKKDLTEDEFIFFLRNLKNYIDTKINYWKNNNKPFEDSEIQKIFLFLNENDFLNQKSIINYKRFSLCKSVWINIRKIHLRRISRYKQRSYILLKQKSARTRESICSLKEKLTKHNISVQMIFPENESDADDLKYIFDQENCFKFECRILEEEKLTTH